VWCIRVSGAVALVAFEVNRVETGANHLANAWAPVRFDVRAFRVLAGRRPSFPSWCGVLHGVAREIECSLSKAPARG
jgi:hypothetical protein